jgi:hypothetical protein
METDAPDVYGLLMSTSCRRYRRFGCPALQARRAPAPRRTVYGRDVHSTSATEEEDELALEDYHGCDRSRLMDALDVLNNRFVMSPFR